MTEEVTSNLFQRSTLFAGANFSYSDFLSSASLITSHELGDKTFLIASLMALQKSRWTVLLGSMSAMTLMNCISIILGSQLQRIPYWALSRLSMTLFLMFGTKMLWDSSQTSPEEEALDDYLKTQKIVAKKKNMKKEIAINKRIIIFTQVFWLIFFAELGDKTQISTILMANNKQLIWPVALGSLLGYFICNVIAIIGARSIERFIVLKKFNKIAGGLFILYALFKF
ncbi:hypothetical protein TYRP_003150 [Tyrophagus putrescentiae]|nr:hypothetical protein TYRP_003150 [Tyrophagus putrescentiae]